MASFSYKALDHKGETEKGFLVAENINEAQNELKNRKLIPIKLKESKQRINLSFFSSISNSKLSFVFLSSAFWFAYITSTIEKEASNLPLSTRILSKRSDSSFRAILSTFFEIISSIF